MEGKRERKTLHLGGDGASQPHIFLRRHDTFFFRGLQKGLHGRMAVFWPGRTFKHLGEHIKGLNGRGMQVSHWHQFTPLVVCCSIEWSLQKWEMFAGSAGGRAEYLISKRACKRNSHNFKHSRHARQDGRRTKIRRHPLTKGGRELSLR